MNRPVLQTSSRVRNRTVASALLLLAAVGPIGMWTILFTSGIPSTQTSTEHAVTLTAYLFTESEHPWFFFLMTALPVIYMGLAAWHWFKRAEQRKIPSWVWILNALATTYAVFVLWPSAIASFSAAYYAHRSNSDA
ncbi:hypothetical protein ACPOLB_23670 [Rubrivivax sp. RP6-9]|uniref:hypothetical protein n=1 Tax=Rubrivivax sp. RP6-9 TaxID=3415750 RepID=UPI003CC5CCAF